MMAISISRTASRTWSFRVARISIRLKLKVIVGSIPGVSEVAVIGMPDEKWGEIVCAIVVADQSKIDDLQIIEYCAARLARYKLPKKIIFAETIPRNPSGKVLKRVLREQYV